jgi:hypothetical protein
MACYPWQPRVKQVNLEDKVQRNLQFLWLVVFVICEFLAATPISFAQG